MKRITKKDPKTGEAYKTSKERRKSMQEYYHRQKTSGKGYKQKAIATTLPKAEAEAIAAIIKAHGVKPAEVIRATAHGLTSGTQTAEAIRQAAQAWTDSQPKPAVGEADTESETPATSPTDNPDGGNE